MAGTGFRRLGDVCRVQKGSTITEKQATPGPFPVIAGGIKPPYYHNLSNRAPGVVAISASGYAGYVSYWRVPIWASDCITVEPLDADSAEPSYLFHALKYIEPTVLQAMQRGAAQKHVYVKDVQEVKLFLPPIEDQRRIASILDAADALRTKRSKALKLAGRLVEANYQATFGGSGTSSWPEVSVGELAAEPRNSIRTGPFGSQLLHEEFTDSGVAVLGIDNAVQNTFAWGQRRFISQEKYRALERYTVFPGDVIVTIMGTCGRAAIVPDTVPLAINTKHLCCITPDKKRCLPEYLWASLLYRRELLRQLDATRGAVMPGLNMGLIRAASLPLPPLKLQQRFADQVRSINRLLDQIQLDRGRLDLLFASLQHRAFRGEL